MIEILKLHHLFELELGIVHDCESHLLKELPKAIEAASSAELQSAFAEDLAQTKAHLAFLDRIFASVLHGLPVDEQDHVLKSIFHESEALIKDIDRSALRDAALIVFGNQVHHHKIALYQSLGSLAQALGFKQAADPLEQAMNAEKAADEKLTQLGLRSVNAAAVGVGNPPHHWEII